MFTLILLIVAGFAAMVFVRTKLGWSVDKLNGEMDSLVAALLPFAVMVGAMIATAVVCKIVQWYFSPEKEGSDEEQYVKH